MLKNWQQHFNCYLHCVTNQTSYSVFLIFLQSFSTFLYTSIVFTNLNFDIHFSYDVNIFKTYDSVDDIF